MTPNEACQFYFALKAHFTSSYNAPKYHFKLKRRIDIETRPEKFYLKKLARHSDPEGLVIANLSVNPKMWAGQLFEKEGQDNYYAWKKYRDALPYWFGQDLSYFEKDSFVVKLNSHPHALRLYLSRKVCLDTMTIIDDYSHYAEVWQETHLKDDPIWKHTMFMISKYRSFLTYNRDKVFLVLSKYFA